MEKKNKTAAKTSAKKTAKLLTKKNKVLDPQDVETTVTLTTDILGQVLFVNFEATVGAYSDKKVKWNLVNNTGAQHTFQINRFKEKVNGNPNTPHNDREKAVPVNPGQPNCFIEYKLKDKTQLVKRYKYTLQVDHFGIDPELELLDLRR